MIFIVGFGTIQGRIGMLDFYFDGTVTRKNDATHHGCTQIWFGKLYISII